MTDASTIIDQIKDYHIHVYYDGSSKGRAEALRAKLEAAFPAAVYGRWHDKPVGPHPEWSYQVHFSTELFPQIVPFVALERNGLTILVHPNTDDDMADHRDYAFWMGKVPELNLGIFEPKA
jgi:aromatic ring-cleaving dioxygenase